jgi:hypothetical protein
LPHHWAPYDDSTDYCGPEDSWVSGLLSRRILGIDCNRCYWAHDQRYRLGKTKEERHFADEQMRRDQNKAILTATAWYSPRRYLALVIAYRRYTMVVTFGAQHFGD